jgi:hypothetical protein
VLSRNRQARLIKYILKTTEWTSSCQAIRLVRAPCGKLTVELRARRRLWDHGALVGGNGTPEWGEQPDSVSGR